MIDPAVGEDEIIGDFGYRGGGCVGLEIDRWDKDLGSPLNSEVIATSENINENLSKLEILNLPDGGISLSTYYNNMKNISDFNFINEVSRGPIIRNWHSNPYI